MYDRNSVALWSGSFSTNPLKMLNPDRIIHISPWWINDRQRDYETALCMTSSCLIIKTNNLQVKSWDTWPVTTVSPAAEKQRLTLAYISLLTLHVSGIESHVSHPVCFLKTIATKSATLLIALQLQTIEHFSITMLSLNLLLTTFHLMHEL